MPRFVFLQSNHEQQQKSKAQYQKIYIKKNMAKTALDQAKENKPENLSIFRER